MFKSSQYIIWLDTETTGLDPIKNAVISIALHVCQGSEVLAQAEFFVKPFDGAVLTERAFDTNGYNSDIVNTFPNSENVLNDIGNFLANVIPQGSRAMWAGHNVGFDLDFLNTTFSKYEKWGIIKKDLIHYHVIDTVSIARFLMLAGAMADDSCSLQKLISKFELTSSVNESVFEYDIKCPPLTNWTGRISEKSRPHTALHDCHSSRIIFEFMSDVVTNRSKS